MRYKETCGHATASLRPPLKSASTRPVGRRAARWTLALLLGGLAAHSGFDALLMDSAGFEIGTPLVALPEAAHETTQIPLGSRAARLSWRLGPEPDVDPDPLETLGRTLAAEYATGRLDLAAARAHLIDTRGPVQGQLVEQSLAARIPWVASIERWLDRFGAWLVLVVLGPVWLFRRLPPHPLRWRRVLAAVPAFVVAAAACLIVYEFMIGSLIVVQSAQLGLGAFGSPVAASTDAAFHHLIAADDPELTRLLDRFVAARALAGSNPVEAVGLVEHLWIGAQAARQSEVFASALQLMRSSAIALDIYLWGLAAATAVLAVQLVVPVIGALVNQPMAAAQTDEGARSWPLLKQQLWVIWREVRATAWLLLFLAVSTLLAVIVIRSLSYPVVAAAMQTLLSTERLLDGGAPLPETALLASVGALALVGLLATLGCAGPAGIVLTKAHLVVRAKIRARGRFRDFPAFWRTIGGLLRRVVLPTLGATIVAFGLYFGALELLDDPRIRLWLPAALVLPAFIVAGWRLHILRELWRLIRLDPLAASAPGSPTDTSPPRPAQSSPKISARKDSRRRIST